MPEETMTEKLKRLAKEAAEKKAAEESGGGLFSTIVKGVQDAVASANNVERTTSTKNLTLGNLADALEAGLIDIDRYTSYLTEAGYSEEDVGILTSLAQQTLAKGSDDTKLSLGTLLGAFENGSLDEVGLRDRLIEAGYKGNDIDLLITSTLKNEMESKGVDYNQIGGNNRMGQEQMSEVKGGAIFDLMNSGEWTELQALNQLKRTGYSEQDAWDLIRMNKKGPENQQTAAPRGGGGGGSRGSQGGRVQYAGSGGGGGGDKPTAQGLLRDFRTSFAQNMKTQGKGLSAGAKTWAMDNMDIFLDDYVGTLGQGGVAGRGAFTKGAAEINTLYEGSKGARQAAYRAGQGTTQARNI
jgi:hypothetical protein